MKSKVKPKANKKRAPFRFLFVIDPWSTLDHPKDTTLRLAQEALALKAEAYVADLRTIRWDRDCVLLDIQKIESVGPARQAGDFKLSEPTAAIPADFDSIHYRTDPPVDLHYLHPLQLLHMGLEGTGVEITNSISRLCLGNEKLEATALADLMPPSLAAAEWDKLLAFGLEEGRTVLKPLHQAQSKGIELLDWTTKAGQAAAQKSLAAATENFERPVLLQRYLAGIQLGEQRLWFVDSKLLACVRKLPLPKDFRVDMDRGSQLARTTLNAAERKAAKQITQHLHQRKIRLAAVDLIDGYVTDFNFTSPGLIVGMEQVLQKNLARPIIQALQTTRPRRPTAPQPQPRPRNAKARV